MPIDLGTGLRACTETDERRFRRKLCEIWRGEPLGEALRQQQNVRLLEQRPALKAVGVDELIDAEDHVELPRHQGARMERGEAEEDRVLLDACREELGEWRRERAR